MSFFAYGEWKQAGAVGPDDAYYLAAEAQRAAWESERKRSASEEDSGSADLQCLRLSSFLYKGFAHDTGTTSPWSSSARSLGRLG